MIVIDHPDPALTSGIKKPGLTRFIKRAQAAAHLSGELSILLADDKQLRQLNKQFRGKNKPTDVLSFPAPEEFVDLAGDLAISLDTAQKQAASFNHTLDQELRVLLLHGILHLAGYDHETDTGEMAAKELDLRTRLKLSTNLIERVQGATSRGPEKKSNRDQLVRQTKRPINRAGGNKK